MEWTGKDDVGENDNSCFRNQSINELRHLKLKHN